MTAADPFVLFDRWLADARAAGAVLPLAMALATANADGMPDARMVMVRSTGVDGFVFFTDRRERQGATSFVPIRAPVLLGYWRELGRQVRVSGAIEETSPTEDEAAFRERPRDAQLAIAGLRQGARIGGPNELRAAVRSVEQRVRGGDVPRPARWGGYPPAPGPARILGGTPGPPAPTSGVPPCG